MAFLVPATAAATFTLGCAVIHAQRRRPDRVTRVLILVVLAILFGFVVRATSNQAAIAEAAADAGDPLLPLIP